MPDLVVAGAGMAGLAAAAHARSRGADVVVYEKGPRAGGAMLLSSGVAWRHASWEAFRAECPGGDPALQRLVFDRLDADLDWLESLGATVTERATGNPRTTGRRFETRALTDALVRACDGVRLGSPLGALPGVPVVLATGGFAASGEMVRERITTEPVMLRTTPWSTGDGLRMGLEAGASLSEGMDEFYGRNMPAGRVSEDRYVSASQLYARFATVVNERGEEHRTSTWSEIDTAQWSARQPRARAWFRVPESALGERVRDRTVAEMIEAAERAGAPVSRDGGTVTVETVAAITTTLGGLRVDSSARAADGVWAAGHDAGGVSTGGYSSGLAAALVLGRVAAESALEAR